MKSFGVRPLDSRISSTGQASMNSFAICFASSFLALRIISAFCSIKITCGSLSLISRMKRDGYF